MPCEFTLNHYAEVCDLLVNAGYKSIAYGEDRSDTSQRRVILRHDIDQSLERATALAEVEARKGLSATYFVWLRSPFYNCFDPVQSRLIRRIGELGHSIGLHFDETAYQVNCLEDLTAKMEFEAEVLSTFGMPVRVVSFHRPSAWVLGSQEQFGWLINAYNSRFFNEYRYVSDSRRQWKQGCVCQLLRDNPPPMLHLLTHAFWWVQEPTSSLDRHILAFLQEKIVYVDSELANNISVYKRFFRGSPDR